MSVTSRQPTECHQCSETYEHGFDGQYCSEACYWRRKGETALNQLRSQHTHCASCGRRLKELDSPDDDWEHARGNAVEVALRHGAEYTQTTDGIGLDYTDVSDVGTTAIDAVCGFQDRTPEAAEGVKEYEGEHEWSQLHRVGTVCTCGATDTHEGDDALRETEWKTVLANYINTFWELEETGAVQQRLDKDVFINVYYQTRDLELALGKGLYGR